MTLMDEQQIRNKILDITGDLTELPDAFERWQLERETIAELFDENQAFCLLNKGLRKALGDAEKIVAMVERDAGMFIGRKTRDRIDEYRETLTKLKNAFSHSKELHEIGQARSVHAVTSDTEAGVVNG